MRGGLRVGSGRPRGSHAGPAAEAQLGLPEAKRAARLRLLALCPRVGDRPCPGQVPRGEAAPRAPGVPFLVPGPDTKHSGIGTAIWFCVHPAVSAGKHSDAEGRGTGEMLNPVHVDVVHVRSRVGRL